MAEIESWLPCTDCPNKPDRRAKDAEFKGKIQEQLTHLVESVSEAKESREKIHRRIDTVEKEKASWSTLIKVAMLFAAVLSIFLGLIQFGVMLAYNHYHSGG